ncbi:Mu transposase C-terminal domain-containing protein [Streptomyces griseoluteus]|uniref:Mu transposase C-terminal domain-containing protein n=1 Tax=Streptomyces griseoluteus TaxID=29306 RepID=UPI00382E9841
MPQPDLLPQQRAAIRHLLDLQHAGRLTRDDKKLVAQGLGCSVKTIERHMANAAAHDGTYTPAPRRRLTLTPAIFDAYGRWRGNMQAAYRDLLQTGHLAIPGQPGRHYSYDTLRRCILDSLDPGTRAGLIAGEDARRSKDLHPRRQRGKRNDAWEGDDKTCNIRVRLDNRAVTPHVTWWADHSTGAICGLAVTPHAPSRDAVLVSLHDAISRRPPHSPFGGAPKLIRIDGGKNFCSAPVQAAMNAIGIDLHTLPPRQPQAKGLIEAINKALIHTHLKGLPGYTGPALKKAPRPAHRLEELLSFQHFTHLLHQWVKWWNFDHAIAALHRRTPAEAWKADDTPLREIPDDALYLFTLETQQRTYRLHSDGIHFKGGIYIPPASLNGHVGEHYVIRYRPHHLDRIELCHPRTNRYLGHALLSTATDPDAIERRKDIHRTRRRQAANLKSQIKALEKSRVRYAALTQPGTPQRLDTQTQPAPLPDPDIFQPRRAPQLPSHSWSDGQDPAAGAPQDDASTKAATPSSPPPRPPQASRRQRRLPPPTPSWSSTDRDATDGDSATP